MQSHDILEPKRYFHSKSYKYFFRDVKAITVIDKHLFDYNYNNLNRMWSNNEIKIELKIIYGTNPLDVLFTAGSLLKYTL